MGSTNSQHHRHGISCEGRRSCWHFSPSYPGSIPEGPPTSFPSTAWRVKAQRRSWTVFCSAEKTGASKEIRTERRWKISTILGAVMDHSLKHMRGRRAPKVNDFAIPKHVENHHQRSSWLLDAGVCSWDIHRGGAFRHGMSWGYWMRHHDNWMRHPRQLDAGGTWYTSMTKGNLHIPSTASPGRWTFGQPSALEKLSPAIGAIFITHRIHGAAILMVTWIPSIDPKC